MARLGLETDIVDEGIHRRTVDWFREAGITLPTFAQLADPASIPDAIHARLEGVDPDAVDALNLFRVHWYNGPDRRQRAAVPGYLVLPQALTGIASPIIVVLGERFPMIHAHKVLAAYGCLAPRVVTGQYDPAAHRAIWPSTGNYCRGGVAISRIMGCRGVAVLPEGMSRERFEWLDAWCTDPSDVVRTPGSESNVKEIYDACAALDAEPSNIVFNQFCEYGNHLVHYGVTGPALGAVVEAVRADNPQWRLAAFTSATGSAGTIAAGDWLKERYGARIVALEALECPTLLYNGFGEHNIQGIGDKHIPLIHNVMNTDVVAAVSDAATNELYVTFNTEAGRHYLTQRRGLDPTLVASLSSLGYSAICNILGAIKTAKYFGLGAEDALITVATDGAGMYGSELPELLHASWPDGFDELSAAEAFGRHMLGCGTGEMLELGYVERQRLFNLGYYTWVEQQGVSVEDFEARRRPEFWIGLRDKFCEWDRLIAEFNAQVQAG